MNGKNICLILSGSIAAYKACELASRLVKAGHTVQAVETSGALRFVGEATLEGLTGRPVYTDLWARNENMTHITLRRWADLFIFYPASANRINQMAAGIADDLVGALFLANNFEKPFWIAPAMNTGMLRHPATQATLLRLQDWGARIISGESGMLACGDVGAGRLAEAAVVARFVEEWGTPVESTARKRLLLTGGAMTEAIDAVRSITNTSTGRTASAIAAQFLQAGWAVDYLHHESADLAAIAGFPATTGSAPQTTSYRSFADFDTSLSGLLAAHSYDAIIHAAAVSDYHVEAPRATKLESADTQTIKLVPNPKLLAGLRARAQGKPAIVGFKLTVAADEKEGLERARTYCKDGAVDFVVWNDLEQLRAAGNGAHPFTLFAASGQGSAAASTGLRATNAPGSSAASTGDVSVLTRGGTNAELARAVLDAVVSPAAPNLHVTTENQV